jgi:hypothetical protein
MPLDTNFWITNPVPEKRVLKSAHKESQQKLTEASPIDFEKTYIISVC